jgi:DNA-binding CsgD family transcriptional regulator
MKKPIPTGADDIRARLAELSPSTRHLLQAATALPSPFRPARLSTLLERRLITLLPDIEEALDSGLLVATGDMLAFGHELVRPIAEASMPAAVAAALRRERPCAAPIRHQPARPADWALLSDRELEVAQLVGLALTNQQIAARLGRSPHTVNFHLRQIFRKLGVASRVELVSLLGKREATR